MWIVVVSLYMILCSISCTNTSVFQMICCDTHLMLTSEKRKYCSISVLSVYSSGSILQVQWFVSWVDFSGQLDVHNNPQRDVRVQVSVMMFVLLSKALFHSWSWFWSVADLNRTKQEVLLVFDGVDTVSSVWLNGVNVGDTDNMFRRYVRSLSKQLTR